MFHELGWKNQPGALGIANCLAEEPVEDPPLGIAVTTFMPLLMFQMQGSNSFLMGAVPFSQ